MQKLEGDETESEVQKGDAETAGCETSFDEM